MPVDEWRSQLSTKHPRRLSITANVFQLQFRRAYEPDAQACNEGWSLQEDCCFRENCDKRNIYRAHQNPINLHQTQPHLPIFFVTIDTPSLGQKDFSACATYRSEYLGGLVLGYSTSTQYCRQPKRAQILVVSLQADSAEVYERVGIIEVPVKLLPALHCSRRKFWLA